MLLMMYAGDRNNCRLGYEQLATQQGISVRSIQDYIKELETAGLITKQRGGRNTCNLYTLSSDL
jgi:predicted transcriptional regulator